jgi:cytochrome c
MRLGNIRLLAVGMALALCAAPATAQEGEKAAEAESVDIGKALFSKRCAQCHSLADGKNGNGPSLFRVINREAAMVPGFKYSRALRQMAADESLKWSEENLTAFLTRPSLLVPGTRMAFPGMSSEESLAALIEWIKANSGPPWGEP